MSITAKKLPMKELSILGLKVDVNSLTARISDGREVTIPIAWFPKLKKASLKDLQTFELSPSGYGIHWPNLDEDISLKAFLTKDEKGTFQKD